MAEKSIAVVIVDGCTLHRAGIRSLIENYNELKVIGEAEDGFGAIDLVRRTQPGILLLGLPLLRRDGLDTTREIVSLRTGTKVVALGSPSVQGYALRVLRAGARGFISTSSSGGELVEAILRVHRGRICIPGDMQQSLTERYCQSGGEETGEEEGSLTDREFQVLCLLAAGHANREIAAKLCVSTKTIDTHRSRILKKLGLRNNADLARYAIKRQYIPV